MKKILISISAAFLFVFLTTTFASALPNKVKSPSAPPEFVSQPLESKLTKVVFIRYKPGFEKEKPCNGNGVCDPGEKGWCSDCKTDGGGEEPSNGCYGFLSGSKPKWNWIENYVYNDAGLGNSSNQATSIWESVSSGDIFGTSSYSNNFNWGDYDYTNTITYGDYSDPNVIGVTAIWYRGKNIYEYDIMFDTDYFPGSTDLDTVVLHEFGHAAGLGDLHDTTCTEEVMYGYYDGVDLDLGPGDTTAIQMLY
jgi:hypothetical protein